MLNIDYLMWCVSFTLEGFPKALAWCLKDDPSKRDCWEDLRSSVSAQAYWFVWATIRVVMVCPAAWYWSTGCSTGLLSTGPSHPAFSHFFILSSHFISPPALSSACFNYHLSMAPPACYLTAESTEWSPALFIMKTARRPGASWQNFVQ